MANKEHFAILQQGVDVWNEWRLKNPNTRPDLTQADLPQANLASANLRGANLRGADLRGADLSRADLSGADFSWADLPHATLRGANLSRADLSRAHLSGATLRGANLPHATLRVAHLSRADLSRAQLRGADLRVAHLSGATLTQADLSQADLSQADLSGAHLRGATLTQADLSRADLRGADLTEAVLIETNLERARLNDCSIYGISAWNLKLEGAAQSNLIITRMNEPTITVDNLEVAQFIYLLLNNEKIRDVINTITTKVVLILGRFSLERKAVLDAIRDELRKCNYLPVMFDFDKPATRDTHETITTLARLARFVIADITDPKSIPQELISIVESLPSLPVQPLLKIGNEPWGMFDHIKRYPWVLPVQQYDQLKDLLSSLGAKIIAPPEAKAKELEKK